MYVLSQSTKDKLHQYKQQVARINGSEDFSAPFEIQPSRHQALIDAYQKVADFLKKINIVRVRDASSDKLGLGNSQRIASTTDTRIQPRRPITIGEIEAIDQYLCTQTDYDVAYMWALIDSWSAYPDFQNRLAALAVKMIANDKQCIGFNGTHRSKTSNKALHPNLEDVNIGWLEKIRRHAPQRYIKNLTVGVAHEFKNMDALVEMIVSELIHERFRNSNDLVVITSPNLVTDKYLNLINQNLAPTEQAAANALYTRKQLGTYGVDTPDHFPAGRLLITSYDNLSIYQQTGSMRRFLKDEPEWNRTSDYQSVNECFVVEDYDKVALIDNVTLEI